ncbi:TetR/AcrR family transcriptional regulator [Microbacterium rhizophilus]|uniref:TetR/AcrR family transcriptional regulator n=1 Tax=Microbacterium rhizophilus TaxID=3138934 RepID=UPI0031E76EF0
MTASTSTRAYHHGDLRAALVAAANEILEEGDAYSLRAVARRAGVSPAAPYRHFADRGRLDTAVAVGGFEDLRRALAEALRRVPTGNSTEVLSELGIAYVLFALRRPAVFRLMFGEEYGGESDDDRVQASQQLHDVLGEVLDGLFPGASSPALSRALWGVAHGLAFLHLDGNYPSEPVAEVVERVRSSVAALLALGHRQEGSR